MNVVSSSGRRGLTLIRPERLRALTLIELLVVMAIIAILATTIAVIGIRVPRGVRIKAARADIRRLSMALDKYKMEFGKHPPDTGFGLDPEPYQNPGTYDPGSLWRYLVKEVHDKRTGRTRGPFLADWPRSRMKAYRDPLLGGKTSMYLTDPWDTPYGFIGERKRVIRNRGSFDLFSAGPDGKTACNNAPVDDNDDGVVDCPSASEETGLQPPVMGLGKFDNRAYNGVDDDGNGKIDDVNEFGPEAILNGDVGDDISNWSRD